MERAKGYLSLSGSHSLERFVNDVAGSDRSGDEDVGLPAARRSGATNRRRRRTWRPTVEDGDDFGSAFWIGLDYTPFIHHLGIATLA
jgi:hypothetical protein